MGSRVSFARKEIIMKFTDGYWQMRPGVSPHYAAQVHEVAIEEDELTVYAPAGQLRERGHTVNQPLLTVHFSSPMENVICVHVVHHKGTAPRKPAFEIRPGPGPRALISETERLVTLTSGDLSMQINKA